MKKFAQSLVTVFTLSAIAMLGTSNLRADNAASISQLAKDNGLKKIESGDSILLRKNFSSNSKRPDAKKITLGEGGQIIQVTGNETVLLTQGSDQGNILAPVGKPGATFATPTNLPYEQGRKIQPSVSDELRRNDTVRVIIRTTAKDSFFGNGRLSHSALSAREEKFQDSRRSIEAVMNAKSKINRDLRVINSFAAVIDAQTLRALEKLTDVLEIQIDSKMYATLDTSTQQIHAPEAWSMADSSTKKSLTGEGVRIAVIDTGVDYTHPDLGGCFGPNCKVIDGYDFVYGDNDPMDDHGHGTHCASTAAGNGPYPGVAPGAKIVAYKVLNANGFGFTSDIVAAVEKSMDPNGDGDTADHVEVISMSIGGSGFVGDPATLAVDSATAVGVTSAIAAGNSGPSSYTVESPGLSPTAITVAAACKPDQIGVNGYCSQPIASFSSRGPVFYLNQDLHKPDLAAPGVSICAARWGTAFAGEPTCIDDHHIRISGTSMATPHVAGAIAILKQAQPSWTPAQIKQNLINNATTLNMSADVQGAGLIHVENSVYASGFVPSVSIQPAYVTINSDATLQVSSHTTTINVTSANITNEILNVALSAPINGVTFTALPSSVNASSTTESFDATFTVNHDAAASGIYSRDILLTNGANELRGSVHVNLNVTPTVSTSTSLVDFGLNQPSLSSWTSDAQSLPITNLRNDISQTIHVSIEFFPANTTLDAPSSITLQPGQTYDLNPTLTVDNSFIGNAIYSGTIVLDNGQGLVLRVPAQFVKYYVLDVVDNVETPHSIVMHNKINTQYVKVGTPGKTSFYINDAGAHDITTCYSNPTNGNLDCVFNENFSITGGQVNTLNTSHASTIYTFENQMTGTDGVANFHPSWSFGVFTYKPVPFLGIGFFTIGFEENPEFNLSIQKFSSVSANYAFERSYSPYMHQDNADFFYDSSANGISSNMTFTNTATDFKGTQLFTGYNMSPGDTHEMNLFYQSVLGIGSYATFPSTTSSTIHIQSLYPENMTVPFNPTKGMVAVRSNYTRLNCPEVGICASVMETPLFYPSLNTGQMFNYSYVPVADRSPEGVFGGLGPNVWFGKFYNDNTTINLGDVHQLGIVLKRQDYSIAEYEDIPYSVLDANDQEIGSGVIPGYYHGFYDWDSYTGGPNILSDSSFDLPNGGKYSVSLTYPYTVKSQTYHASVKTTFKTTHPTDKNPPSITKLYFYRNDGLNRSESDYKSKTNRIEFEIDPVDGTLDILGTTASFTFSDGVTGKIKLDSWASANGYTFSGKIKKNLGTPTKVTITITAKDVAKNKLVYTFELPVQ